MDTFPNLSQSEVILHKLTISQKRTRAPVRVYYISAPASYSFSSPQAACFRTWRMPSTGKPCHNCRRRRLRCDRSWPTCHKCAVSGQECLGYGKVFVWTQGIDSNGNLRPSPPGRRAVDATRFPYSGTLHAIASAPASATASTTASHNRPPASTSDHRANGPSRPNIIRPTSTEFSSQATAGLTDPIFQDLDRNSRYYLAYCKSPSSYVRKWACFPISMLQAASSASTPHAFIVPTCASLHNRGGGRIPTAYAARAPTNRTPRRKSISCQRFPLLHSTKS